MTTASKFPLLRLPYLCIQNVIEFWYPFSLYSFTTISQKADKVVKMNFKRAHLPLEIELSNDFELSVSALNQTNSWFISFKPSNGIRHQALIQEDGSGFNVTHRDFFTIGIKCLRKCMDLYKVHIANIYINPMVQYSLENLLELIGVINEHQQSLPVQKVILTCLVENLGSVFVQNYQKSTDHYYIVTNFDSRDTVLLPKTLEVRELQVKHPRLDIHFTLSMNCNFASSSFSSLSNQDMNTFLKSWSSGESNRKLKYFFFGLNVKVDIFKVLKGLSPKIRNPTTTKRQIEDGRRKGLWIHGGIDIEGVDGKVATICKLYMASQEPNEPVPQKVIEDYEEALGWDWNDPLRFATKEQKVMDMSDFLCVHFW